MDNTKEYVVLEHLMLPDRGFRFFTVNCRHKNAEADRKNNTHGYNGELWYEEVGFADTVEEAQAICRDTDSSKFPTWQELYDYHAEESRKRDLAISDKFQEDFDPEIFKKNLDK